MAPGDPKPPGRTAGPLLGGCLWALLGALLLVVLGLVLTSVMVTSFFDRPQDPKSTTPSTAPTGRTSG
ncbi:hypothetical protein ACFUT3_29140 [Streptomyces cinereoruber]|uniref:hypothetical protein n=1 Tax=Streptomyces cinereoruber TaxID=67260 RepID=UPI003631FB3B